MSSQTSIYLARLIGPVLALLGVSMLLDPMRFLILMTEMLGDAGMLYFSAVLGLLAGIALVLAHNVWAADWRVIITLLGWITIVDSASLVLAPQLMARFWAPALTPTLPLIGGVVVLILGAILCYFGYVARGR